MQHAKREHSATFPYCFFLVACCSASVDNFAEKLLQNAVLYTQESAKKEDVFLGTPKEVIQPKHIKKEREGLASDYVVVLGGFGMKKTPPTSPRLCGAGPTSLQLRGASTASLSLHKTSSASVAPEHRRSPISHRGNFAAPVSKFASFLLLILVAGNPLIPVYADELPPAFPDLLVAPTPDEIPSSENVITQESEIPLIEVEQVSTEVSEPDTTTSSDETADTAAPANEAPVINVEENTTEETLEPESIPISEETIDDAEPAIPVETSTDEPSTTTPAEEETTVPEESTVSEEVTTSTEEATDTEEEIVAQEEVVPAEEDNAEIPAPSVPAVVPPSMPTPVAQPKVFFKDNECTPMDDGGFYCVSPDLASTTGTTNVRAPRVYAEAGVNDDKEIFYEDTYEKTQITSNDYDDDAPSYDERSSIILWQALVNGRYQIMFYERAASSTSSGIRQLTDTIYNNTNPYINGKSAVWQGWVNDNWEIFYVKDVTAPALEVRQITSNAKNDMFPNLSEKFITWQSFFDDTWHVFVYDMETAAISQITKTADGKYENPRFALLFERRNSDGEVETIGYDVASGKEIPISHGAGGTSIPLPEIPQADNDKALPIQSGTSTTTVKNPEKDGEGGE